MTRDLWIAPICEGALLLIAGAAGFVLHAPLLFASLGPTAYELVETPERPSARAYNIFTGHLIGVMAGFAALLVFHAYDFPGIASGTVAGARIGAAIFAAALTVLLTLALKAAQPAAVSTTLLIALGSLQRWQDGLAIMGAVLLMLIFGEPLRRWRLRSKSPEPLTPSIN